ncbi:hypothetical protein SCE1572_49965 [Sorangium cellulosum So0157-2]|uniref:Uncharacterized protein n=1 Tax=Sorangium cellulosum So0157-2 TaxID=1254432 RepID=S4YC32_SORCE|nr:hypothetical protein SCE1572_49965 [Sorangium cellulosum So0157-2]
MAPATTGLLIAIEDLIELGAPPNGEHLLGITRHE